MDRVVARVGNGYKLCILGYLNGWVEDRERVGLTDDFSFSCKK